MKYSVLGPVELHTAAGPVKIHSTCIQAMLAILLMSPRQVVSVDRIIDDMWPEEPPRSAVENVRTYVYQLRRLLNSTDRHSILKSVSGGYQLDIDPDELDLTHFQRLAEEGRRALSCEDNEKARTLFVSALKLWRAAPLAGLTLSRAMRAKAVALEEQHLQVQVQWIQARIALNEAGEVIAPLRGLLGERPLDERLWHLLMRSLARSGRTGESLAAYDEARRTLVHELGSEPGRELRELHASLLRGEREPNPERAVLRSVPNAVPHQLPSDTRQLVGRECQLRAIRELAERSFSGELNHPATVLLSGLPGVGKTALAVTAAEQLRDLVPDGELYVNLDGRDTSSATSWDAMASLLSAFGVAPRAIPDSADNRRSLYRSLLAERRVLVIVDGVSDNRQIVPLIPGPGHSVLLVTSRRRLTRVYADLRLSLDVMTAEDALTMLANTIGSDRVAAEPEAARQVVLACGCLPAVIRVAAVRLSTRAAYPIQVLADRLSDGEGLLDEFDWDGYSLRDRLDRSYQSMNPQQQKHFRAIGAVTPEAISAAAVGRVARTSAHAADRELEGLTNEGMLVAQMSSSGIPNYRLPTVMHAYAKERLAHEGLSQAAGVEKAQLTG